LKSLLDFVSEQRKLVITVEVLFTLAFVAWAVVRAYAPDKIMSSGGEKWMEIAFLNGTLNSVHFPPLDPWLAGYSISYYYFGYVMMALVTRLSGAPATVGFDLYDALLFALTMVGAFGVVYNLVGGSRRAEQAKNAQNWALSAGWLGGIFVAVLGNLEGVFEGLRSWGVLPEGFWKWLSIPGLGGAAVNNRFFPGNGWWWWRASRVLEDLDLRYTPIGTQPIDEFPFFSFLLGDNHPHVLALPFVLVAIGLALNLLRRMLATKEQAGTAAAWWNPLGALDNDWLLFIFCALWVGALGFLNTWDFPIYLGLVMLAYAVGVLARASAAVSQPTAEGGEQAAPFRLDLFLGRWIVLGLSWLAAAVVLYIFFFVGFRSQAGGLLPYIFPPTRLPQYLVMFGPFIVILTGFQVAYIIRQGRQGNGRRLLGLALRTWGWVMGVCYAIFLLLLVTAALAFLIAPEVEKQFALRTLLSYAPSLNLPADVLAVVNAGGAPPVSQAAAIAWAVLGPALLARLANPWLFLFVTALLALTLTNLWWHVQAGVRRTAHKPQGGRRGTPSTAAREAEAPGQTTVSASTLFAFLLIFFGLALTLSVEFVYLRDNFGVRMNTIFKFYYQGWITLGCAAAYGLWWLSSQGERAIGKAGWVVSLALSWLVVIAGLVYPVMATTSRVYGFCMPLVGGGCQAPSLDAASGVARSNPDDWAAINWLRANARTADGMTPVILEAPGNSYTYESRISAFTGWPTLLGWRGHEGQWRGDYVVAGQREPDIATMYTTRDAQQMLELLHKWNVNYVIVGRAERNYIQQTLCNDPTQCNITVPLRKFGAALTAVFTQGETTVYQVP
jgi:uncharacterized membrane protein